MSCCLKAGFSVCGSSDIVVKNRAKQVSSTIESLQFKESNFTEFWAKTLDSSDQKHVTNFKIRAPKLNPSNAQPSVCLGKSMRWWEKSHCPNMIEIQSAQQLVHLLLNAEDKLVVLDFYSPACGGCKTLHPKMCQLAEMNQNALFLKVNYEEHKAMCNALNVHVLPFFSFYRGAGGKACSFSCTNATFKKFKDALAKHGGDDRCSPGPAKGLGESELLALASMGLISEGLEPNVVVEEFALLHR